MEGEGRSETDWPSLWRGEVGTAVDIRRRELHPNASGNRGRRKMTHGPNSVNFGVGGLAFIAGILATLVTAYAVVSRRNASTQKVQYHYDGWDDSLGA
jgi:hypothetical protein